MVPGHRLTEIIIWMKCNENRSKGAEDIEQTPNSRVKHMTLNYTELLKKPDTFHLLQTRK